jgi:hypothetical protein
MSAQGVKKVLLEAMADKAFRSRLVADPAAAAKSIGVKLTPDEVNSFKANLSASRFRKLAEADVLKRLQIGAAAGIVGWV